MWKVSFAALILVVASLPCVTRIAVASSGGPPPARTGGFGEMTCHECHWDNPINDPAGSFSLTGIPPAYTPGEAYTITVSVAHPDMKRGGFELSARGEGAPGAGATAGRLNATDGLTRVTEEKGITYISQSDAGSKAITGEAGRWTFEWTAPASGEAVVFHAAANAANGDASPLGDSIYTAVTRTGAH